METQHIQRERDPIPVRGDIMSIVEEILEHHGVKGQKWGVRRADKSTSSHESVQTLPPKSHDAANAQATKATAKVHGVSVLSNKELQDFITRANLEQQFSNVSASKKEKGRKATKQMLLNIGKQQLSSQIVRGLTTAVMQTFKGGPP